MRVAVDEARHHASTLGADPSVGTGAGLLDREHSAVFDDHGRVSYEAEWSLATSRVACDEQAEFVDDERHRSDHSARTARSSCTATLSGSRAISCPATIT